MGRISSKTQQIFQFLFLPCLFLSLLHVSEVAPYLRGEGLRRQVVLEGNRLVLTCLAGGSWPLQYRWTLNNSNLTDWTPHYRSVVTQMVNLTVTIKLKVDVNSSLICLFVHTSSQELLWSPGNCYSSKLVCLSCNFVCKVCRMSAQLPQ